MRHGLDFLKVAKVYAATSLKILIKICLWDKYARIQFLPSHFMLSFKKAFYTGFFEQERPSCIFSPIIKDY